VTNRAYILDSFPNVSESFILDEITLLQEHGVRHQRVAERYQRDVCTAKSSIFGVRCRTR